jgi:transcription regulator MmyB-like protein
MRIALHPDGLAPRVINLGQWRAHLLHRLDRQIRLTGDERLLDLRDELLGYPGAPAREPVPPCGELMVELKLATEDGGQLSFFSTVTTFGTALDITISELSIEAFFPADASTAAALNEAAAVA